MADVFDTYSGKDRFGKDWSKATRSRFWRAPHWSRRVFFKHMATAMSGYFLLPRNPLEGVAQAAATPINTAKNCIFVLLGGANSHVDTFDLKVGSWTPGYFNPTRYGDLLWPQGLMPKLGEQMDNIAVVRSVRAWATAHGVAQSWAQIVRNPISGLARIAPHIGSVVALELGGKLSDRTLPAFMALNTNSGGPAEGYFKPEYAPMYVSPGGGGLTGTRHPDGQPAFDRRYGLLMELDGAERSSPTLGTDIEDFASFNAAARKLMNNADVDRIFTFDQNARNAYGNTSFGNACLTARNLLRARMGTRFVQITFGGWDHHVNIYQPNTNIQSQTRALDNGLSQLMADLRADGLLNDTLIVVMGEFGRTVGPLNSQAGRDHHPQQAVLFAGARVTGRKAIGTTDEVGARVTEPGWAGSREVRAEDIGATIYSALGIDWTTIRRDDPFGRGFEYIPSADKGDYRPVHELWS
jgi:hypothetical protein